MLQSGVLSPGHRSSCFWVGTLFQRFVCFHANIKSRSFVRLSICTMAHSKSLERAGVRGKKKKIQTFYFIPYSTLIFFSWNALKNTDSPFKTRWKLWWISGRTSLSTWSTVTLRLRVIDGLSYCFLIWFGHFSHHWCRLMGTDDWFFFFFLSSSILTIYGTLPGKMFCFFKKGKV